MTLGQGFDGTLQTAGDIDWVKVTLTAGRTYVLRMDGADGSAVDAVLRLRGNTGAVMQTNDDTNGKGAQIEFTASRTGTYFLDARSFNGETAGDYPLQEYEGQALDITFDDEDTGAYSTSNLSTDGSVILNSFVNLAQNWNTDPVSVNSYWFQTMVHEIGHALGLGQAGNYNGDAT